MFTKRANEGRVKASLTFGGGWQTAFGLLGSDSTFQAIGEESFVPKTDTRSLGAFAVARNNWERVTAEFGARVDTVKYQTDIGVDRDFTPTSFSASGGFRFNEQWRLTANLDHAERAPAEEELFANGPHIATLTFEIGGADLQTEKANQAELGLNFQNAWVDAKVAAYYNRYNDFIYIVDTGGQWFNEEDNDFLPIRQWTQADATFHGFEGEATFIWPTTITARGTCASSATLCARV